MSVKAGSGQSQLSFAESGYLRRIRRGITETFSVYSNVRTLDALRARRLVIVPALLSIMVVAPVSVNAQGDT